MAVQASRSALKQVKRRLSKMEITRENRAQIKDKVKKELQRIVGERSIDVNEDSIRAEVRAIIERYPAFSDALGKEGLEELEAAIVVDIVQYGPIQGLLEDDSVTEVMVNGCDNVFFERAGRCEESSARFSSDDDVELLIDRIAADQGRVCNDQFPQLDARLPDGSRVHATKRGATPGGPTITIRKFSPSVRSLDDYVRRGSCSKQMAAFLAAAVEAKTNILVTGGTGAGKTSLLNALSVAIPEQERVLTIEDNKELMLSHRNWVSMEARPANSEGAGEVTIRDLVRGSLRMRPDRIVVGECRGAEAFDMLQAMNTGHDGSLTTIHANSARAALTRLESMTAMAGEAGVDAKGISQMIQTAIEVIVHVERLRDGRRVISEIEEVDPSGGEIIKTQTVFRRDPVSGRYDAAGFPPARTVERFLAADVDYDKAWFYSEHLQGAL